ncbi:MAG TPA: hypothetical protein VMN81_09570 [Vicinamibacterales bacterium]|nr:hypothetical protein [Vicinamibacterales bacterium]
MRAALAVLLANLPVRWWGPFEERYPLHRVAWLSGLATMLAGVAVGIPGYLDFLQEAAHGFNAGIGADPDLGIKSSGWAMASLPVFLLATPLGLFSTYLTASGFMRAVSAFIADEAHGDLLLTGIDAAARRIVAHEDHVRRASERMRLEGPAMPDRLVTGASLGRADAEFVLLASRVKVDWERNAYLVTSEGRAYRIGEPFDVTLPAGLRKAYPLTELRTGEAIRYAIPSDLPPVWRDRKA